MGITFTDGTTLDTEDWYRIMSVVKERARQGKPAPASIEQGGVTVNLAGLEAKAGSVKHGHGAEYSKYVESSYKNWKIRVWRMEKEQVYGVNYFKGEDVRYMEVPVGDVRDENGVFKYVQCFVDEIED